MVCISYNVGVNMSLFITKFDKPSNDSSSVFQANKTEGRDMGLDDSDSSSCYNIHINVGADASEIDLEITPVKLLNKLSVSTRSPKCNSKAVIIEDEHNSEYNSGKYVTKNTYAEGQQQYTSSVPHNEGVLLKVAPHCRSFIGENQPITISNYNSIASEKTYFISKETIDNNYEDQYNIATDQHISKVKKESDIQHSTSTFLRNEGTSNKTKLKHNCAVIQGKRELVWTVKNPLTVAENKRLFKRKSLLIKNRRNSTNPRWVVAKVEARDEFKRVIQQSISRINCCAEEHNESTHLQIRPKISETSEYSEMLMNTSRRSTEYKNNNTIKVNDNTRYKIENNNNNNNADTSDVHVSDEKCSVGEIPKLRGCKSNKHMYVNSRKFKTNVCNKSDECGYHFVKCNENSTKVVEVTSGHGKVNVKVPLCPTRFENNIECYPKRCKRHRNKKVVSVFNRSDQCMSNVSKTCQMESDSEDEPSITPSFVKCNVHERSSYCKDTLKANTADYTNTSTLLDITETSKKYRTDNYVSQDICLKYNQCKSKSDNGKIEDDRLKRQKYHKPSDTNPIYEHYGNYSSEVQGTITYIEEVMPSGSADKCKNSGNVKVNHKQFEVTDVDADSCRIYQNYRIPNVSLTEHDQYRNNDGQNSVTIPNGDVNDRCEKYMNIYKKRDFKERYDKKRNKWTTGIDSIRLDNENVVSHTCIENYTDNNQTVIDIEDELNSCCERSQSFRNHMRVKSNGKRSNQTNITSKRSDNEEEMPDLEHKKAKAERKCRVCTSIAKCNNEDDVADQSPKEYWKHEVLLKSNACRSRDVPNCDPSKLGSGEEKNYRKNKPSDKASAVSNLHLNEKLLDARFDRSKEHGNIMTDPYGNNNKIILDHHKPDKKEHDIKLQRIEMNKYSVRSNEYEVHNKQSKKNHHEKALCIHSLKSDGINKMSPQRIKSSYDPSISYIMYKGNSTEDSLSNSGRNENGMNILQMGSNTCVETCHSKSELIHSLVISSSTLLLKRNHTGCKLSEGKMNLDGSKYMEFKGIDVRSKNKTQKMCKESSHKSKYGKQGIRTKKRISKENHYIEDDYSQYNSNNSGDSVESSVELHSEVELENMPYNIKKCGKYTYTDCNPFKTKQISEIVRQNYPGIKKERGSAELLKFSSRHTYNKESKEQLKQNLKWKKNEKHGYNPMQPRHHAQMERDEILSGNSPKSVYAVNLPIGVKDDQNCEENPHRLDGNREYVESESSLTIQWECPSNKEACGSVENEDDENQWCSSTKTPSFEERNGKCRHEASSVCTQQEKKQSTDQINIPLNKSIEPTRCSRKKKYSKVTQLNQDLLAVKSSEKYKDRSQMMEQTGTSQKPIREHQFCNPEYNISDQRISTYIKTAIPSDNTRKSSPRQSQVSIVTGKNIWRNKNKKMLLIQRNQMSGNRGCTTSTFYTMNNGNKKVIQRPSTIVKNNVSTLGGTEMSNKSVVRGGHDMTRKHEMLNKSTGVLKQHCSKKVCHSVPKTSAIFNSTSHPLNYTSHNLRENKNKDLCTKSNTKSILAQTGYIISSYSEREEENFIRSQSEARKAYDTIKSLETEDPKEEICSFTQLDNKPLRLMRKSNNIKHPVITTIQSKPFKVQNNVINTQNYVEQVTTKEVNNNPSQPVHSRQTGRPKSNNQTSGPCQQTSKKTQVIGKSKISFRETKKSLSARESVQRRLMTDPKSKQSNLNQIKLNNKIPSGPQNAQKNSSQKPTIKPQVLKSCLEETNAVSKALQSHKQTAIGRPTSKRESLKSALQKKNKVAQDISKQKNTTPKEYALLGKDRTVQQGMCETCKEVGSAVHIHENYVDSIRKLSGSKQKVAIKDASILKTKKNQNLLKDIQMEINQLSIAKRNYEVNQLKKCTFDKEILLSRHEQGGDATHSVSSRSVLLPEDKKAMMQFYELGLPQESVEVCYVTVEPTEVHQHQNELAPAQVDPSTNHYMNQSHIRCMHSRPRNTCVEEEDDASGRSINDPVTQCVNSSRNWEISCHRPETSKKCKKNIIAQTHLLQHIGARMQDLRRNADELTTTQDTCKHEGNISTVFPYDTNAGCSSCQSSTKALVRQTKDHVIPHTERTNSNKKKCSYCESFCSSHASNSLLPSAWIESPVLGRFLSEVQSSHGTVSFTSENFRNDILSKSKQGRNHNADAHQYHVQRSVMVLSTSHMNACNSKCSECIELFRDPTFSFTSSDYFLAGGLCEFINKNCILDESEHGIQELVEQAQPELKRCQESVTSLQSENKSVVEEIEECIIFKNFRRTLNSMNEIMERKPSEIKISDMNASYCKLCFQDNLPLRRLAILLPRRKSEPEFRLINLKSNNSCLSHEVYSNRRNNTEHDIFSTCHRWSPSPHSDWVPEESSLIEKPTTDSVQDGAPSDTQEMITKPKCVAITPDRHAVHIMDNSSSIMIISNRKHSSKYSQNNHEIPTQTLTSSQNIRHIHYNMSNISSITQYPLSVTQTKQVVQLFKNQHSKSNLHPVIHNNETASMKHKPLNHGCHCGSKTSDQKQPDRITCLCGGNKNKLHGTMRQGSREQERDVSREHPSVESLIPYKCVDNEMRKEESPLEKSNMRYFQDTEKQWISEVPKWCKELEQNNHEHPNQRYERKHTMEIIPPLTKYDMPQKYIELDNKKLDKITDLNKLVPLKTKSPLPEISQEFLKTSKEIEKNNTRHDDITDSKDRVIHDQSAKYPLKKSVDSQENTSHKKLIGDVKKHDSKPVESKDHVIGSIEIFSYDYHSSVTLDKRGEPEECDTCDITHSSMTKIKPDDTAQKSIEPEKKLIESREPNRDSLLLPAETSKASSTTNIVEVNASERSKEIPDTSSNLTETKVAKPKSLHTAEILQPSSAIRLSQDDTTQMSNKLPESGSEVTESAAAKQESLHLEGTPKPFFIRNLSGDDTTKKYELPESGSKLTEGKIAKRESLHPIGTPKPSSDARLSESDITKKSEELAESGSKLMESKAEEVDSELPVETSKPSSDASLSEDDTTEKNEELPKSDSKLTESEAAKKESVPNVGTPKPSSDARLSEDDTTEKSEELPKSGSKLTESEAAKKESVFPVETPKPSSDARLSEDVATKKSEELPESGSKLTESKTVEQESVRPMGTAGRLTDENGAESDGDGKDEECTCSVCSVLHGGMHDCNCSTCSMQHTSSEHPFHPERSESSLKLMKLPLQSDEKYVPEVTFSSDECICSCCSQSLDSAVDKDTEIDSKQMLGCTCSVCSETHMDLYHNICSNVSTFGDTCNSQITVQQPPHPARNVACCLEWCCENESDESCDSSCDDVMIKKSEIRTDPQSIGNIVTDRHETLYCNKSCVSTNMDEDCLFCGTSRNIQFPDNPVVYTMTNVVSLNPNMKELVRMKYDKTKIVETKNNVINTNSFVEELETLLLFLGELDTWQSQVRTEISMYSTLLNMNLPERRGEYNSISENIEDSPMLHSSKMVNNYIRNMVMENESNFYKSRNALKSCPKRYYDSCAITYIPDATRIINCDDKVNYLSDCSTETNIFMLPTMKTAYIGNVGVEKSCLTIIPEENMEDFQHGEYIMGSKQGNTMSKKLRKINSSEQGSVYGNNLITVHITKLGNLCNSNNLELYRHQTRMEHNPNKSSIDEHEKIASRQNLTDQQGRNMEPTLVQNANSRHASFPIKQENMLVSIPVADVIAYTSIMEIEVDENVHAELRKRLYYHNENESHYSCAKNFRQEIMNNWTIPNKLQNKTSVLSEDETVKCQGNGSSCNSSQASCVTEGADSNRTQLTDSSNISSCEIDMTDCKINRKLARNRKENMIQPCFTKQIYFTHTGKCMTELGVREPCDIKSSQPAGNSVIDGHYNTSLECDEHAPDGSVQEGNCICISHSNKQERSSDSSYNDHDCEVSTSLQSLSDVSTSPYQSKLSIQNDNNQSRNKGDMLNDSGMEQHPAFKTESETDMDKKSKNLILLNIKGDKPLKTASNDEPEDVTNCTTKALPWDPIDGNHLKDLDVKMYFIPRNKFQNVFLNVETQTEESSFKDRKTSELHEPAFESKICINQPQMSLTILGGHYEKGCESKNVIYNINEKHVRNKTKRKKLSFKSEPLIEKHKNILNVGTWPNLIQKSSPTLETHKPPEHDIVLEQPQISLTTLGSSCESKRLINKYVNSLSREEKLHLQSNKIPIENTHLSSPDAKSVPNFSEHKHKPPFINTLKEASDMIYKIGKIQFVGQFATKIKRKGSIPAFSRTQIKKTKRAVDEEYPLNKTTYKRISFNADDSDSVSPLPRKDNRREIISRISSEESFQSSSDDSREQREVIEHKSHIVDSQLDEPPTEYIINKVVEAYESSKQINIDEVTGGQIRHRRDEHLLLRLKNLAQLDAKESSKKFSQEFKEGSKQKLYDVDKPDSTGDVPGPSQKLNEHSKVSEKPELQTLYARREVPHKDLYSPEPPKDESPFKSLHITRKTPELEEFLALRKQKSDTAKQSHKEESPLKSLHITRKPPDKDELLVLRKDKIDPSTSQKEAVSPFKSLYITRKTPGLEEILALRKDKNVPQKYERKPAPMKRMEDVLGVETDQIAACIPHEKPFISRMYPDKKKLLDPARTLSKQPRKDIQFTSKVIAGAPMDAAEKCTFNKNVRCKSRSDFQVEDTQPSVTRRFCDLGFMTDQQAASRQVMAGAAEVRPDNKSVESKSGAVNQSGLKGIFYDPGPSGQVTASAPDVTAGRSPDGRDVKGKSRADLQGEDTQLSGMGIFFDPGLQVDPQAPFGQICFMLSSEKWKQLHKQADLSFSSGLEGCDPALEFLLALGFSLTEATAAIMDKKLQSCLHAAIIEACVWVPYLTKIQRKLIYLLAYKCKPKTMRYFLQLVKAIVHRKITNVVKLDGFLKMLEVIEDGDTNIDFFSEELKTMEPVKSKSKETKEPPDRGADKKRAEPVKSKEIKEPKDRRADKKSGSQCVGLNASRSSPLEERAVSDLPSRSLPHVEQPVTPENTQDMLKEMFITVFRIAEKQANAIKKPLNKASIRLLRLLITKYCVQHHSYLIANWIGQGRITTETQLKAAKEHLNKLGDGKLKLLDLAKSCGVTQTD